ncbi:hypothetical protein F4778DRAFT_280867 [Xylariomycetidae sp. FL2044]|nr:hypothetical protein F4778DRAFT_280867 [Xylariomycetidae sp. FL2044]
MIVDLKDSRDHFALECTFLGYLRTSMILPLTGVVFAQLTVVQQQDSGFGYHLNGGPMCMTCLSYAVSSMVLGACRFYHFQRAMAKGKALTGGVELHAVAIMVLGLLATFLCLTLVIDTTSRPIDHSKRHEASTPFTAPREATTVS